MLFLWGLLTTLRESTGGLALLGAVAGLVGAAILGWAVFQGGRRLSIQRFFAATSVLLLFLAGGLFSAAVGRLQGLGVLPFGDPLWDTSWLLDDHGPIGGLLAGLVGYRARPTALEVAAYLVHLGGAGALFFPAVVRTSFGPQSMKRMSEP